MAYNSISIKHYIKSHLELQREITLIELAPSPYFFVLSICLAYMNMFARFDENPAMTLLVIKETKRYGRTDARTDARTDNVKTVYPLQTKFAGGIINKPLVHPGKLHVQISEGVGYGGKQRSFGLHMVCFEMVLYHNEPH